MAARPGLDFLCSPRESSPSNLANTGEVCGRGVARRTTKLGFRVRARGVGPHLPRRDASIARPTAQLAGTAGPVPNVSFFGQEQRGHPHPARSRCDTFCLHTRSLRATMTANPTGVRGSDSARRPQFPRSHHRATTPLMTPPHAANQATEGTTGCATAPLTCDYETTSGSVTFSVGEVEKRIKVKIAGDSQLRRR